MNDEDVARLANIVSERVFESMSKFVGVLEDIIRENELLRSKVAELEFMVFGPDDSEPYEFLGEVSVQVDDIDDFFDVDGDIEDDDLLDSN